MQLNFHGKPYQIKTITEVRNAFWEMLKETDPESAKERRSRKRQNAYKCDIRTSFIGFVESLRRDDQISEKLAGRVTL